MKEANRMELRQAQQWIAFSGLLQLMAHEECWTNGTITTSFTGSALIWAALSHSGSIRMVRSCQPEGMLHNPLTEELNGQLTSTGPFHHWLDDGTGRIADEFPRMPLAIFNPAYSVLEQYYGPESDRVRWRFIWLHDVDNTNRAVLISRALRRNEWVPDKIHLLCTAPNGLLLENIQKRVEEEEVPEARQASVM